jgi:hypothetical protein
LPRVRKIWRLTHRGNHGEGEDQGEWNTSLHLILHSMFRVNSLSDNLFSLSPSKVVAGWKVRGEAFHPAVKKKGRVGWVIENTTVS